MLLRTIFSLLVLTLGLSCVPGCQSDNDDGTNRDRMDDGTMDRSTTGGNTNPNRVGSMDR